MFFTNKKLHKIIKSERLRTVLYISMFKKVELSFLIFNGDGKEKDVDKAYSIKRGVVSSVINGGLEQKTYRMNLEGYFFLKDDDTRYDFKNIRVISIFVINSFKDISYDQDKREGWIDMFFGAESKGIDPGDFRRQSQWEDIKSFNNHFYKFISKL